MLLPEVVWMVNLGALMAVTLPWTSSHSPLSSSSPASPAGTLVEVTLNVGETVTLVPLMVNDDARSRSKLMKVGVLPTVMFALKVTVAVPDVGLAVSLVGTPAFTATISGFDQLTVAPE